MKLINHCYYINLDRRPDRNKIMKDLVIPFFRFSNNEYTRFSAIDKSQEKTLSLRSVGCAESHLRVMKDAIVKNYNYILILEDDFLPSVKYKEFEFRWNYFIENYKDFNLCQIAYNNMSKAHKCDDSGLVYFCDNSQTTSAYIIKIDFAKKIISHIEECIQRLSEGGSPSLYAYDQAWKKFQTPENKWFQLARCGFQRADYSDLEQKNVNYKV
jgi:GR25 family glycosyltransferase involved in LPS biosynthesis